MFLRASTRKKNGKEHRYWSIVENRRVAGGRVVQRHVLYLGEINDSQQAAWRKTIEVFEERDRAPRSLALFPEDRAVAPSVADEYDRADVLERSLRLRRPRSGVPAGWRCSCGSSWSWITSGASVCRPAAKARAGIRCCRAGGVSVAIDPGSEWRLHREWFENSAMADLLGADYRPGAE